MDIFRSCRFEYIVLFQAISSGFHSSCASPIKSESLQSDGLFVDAHVFLTVSSISGVGENAKFLNRLLEMNWNNIVPLTKSWIGVFDYNPEEFASNNHFQNALSKMTPLVNGTGTFKTKIRYAEIDNKFRANTTADGCNGFWIAYFREDNIPTLKNCLKLHPTWMNDLRETIGDTPLTSLMIPGSHNAGAWKIYAGTPDDNFIIKYLYNQEDPIYAQLMHGIRFFDIRVGHYPEAKEVYYINHDVIQIRPLVSFFNDVKRFISETNEVVLLDMHRFPVGFANNTDHEEFIQFIAKELGPLLFLKSSGRNPTLNQVRDAGKSIILSYGDSAFSNQRDFLWPAVYHAWGDVNQVEKLESYLSNAMTQYGCQGIFWSAMAELTPKSTDIILKPDVGLRGFAEIINLPIVTSWFQRKAWYSKANIISTDYYLGNNIIEIAVRVNENKAVCA